MELTTRPQPASSHPVFLGPRPPGGLRGRLFRWAVRQFGRPTGFWGGVAGRIMARRPSNLERNRWTIDLLDVQPTDWVLEIGFGPGVALEWLAECAHQGLVVGIDHSEVMLRQAARRNALAIGEGRIALQLGSAESLPDLGTAFDKIMAVNVAMFWGDPVRLMGALRERLRPGGLLAVTVQPRAPGATDADAERIGAQLVQQLAAAGFREPRLEVRPMHPVAAVCALGRR